MASNHVANARRWSPETLLEAQAMAGVQVWEWLLEDGETFARDLGRFLATVVPEDRPTLELAVARAIDEGQGFDFELRTFGEDGPRTLHAVATVTVDPGTGRTTRILGAPPAGVSPEAAMRTADRAMYRAKSAAPG